MAVTGQLLLQAHQMVSLSKPAARDYLSIQNFLGNGFQEGGKILRPLVQGDSEFIRREEDLVTLRPRRENAGLDAFVERFLKMINCKPIQVCSASSLVPGMSWTRANNCCL